MSNPYLGEIRAFGFTFAPRGWATCDGQIIAIQQNTALFSILGTYYGGNGTTNFALPNLQGDVTMNQGSGAGLPAYTLGEQVGETAVTLNQTQMPAHVHTINGSVSGDVTEAVPTPTSNTTLGAGLPGEVYDNVATDASVAFSPKAIGLAGSGLPHQNMQPYLAINYCICTAGIFPVRN